MSSSGEWNPNAQSSGSDSPRSVDGIASWEILAAHVERFLAAWDTESAPPLLADHLPSGDPVLRQLVLTELVKVDLEYRHQSGINILRLEDYAAEHQELAGPNGIPADLIFEEYHVRKSSGDTPDANEYLSRFPQQADALAQLLDFDAPTSSSSLSGVQVHETFDPGDRIDDFYLMSKLGTGAVRQRLSR